MDEFVIGICEDEKCIHDLVKEMLDQYAKKRNIEYKVLDFFSGTELLESTQEMDMLFLDIVMPEPDGIETARRLNQRGISYKIVLLTGNPDYFKEGYKIGAFRFVTKPIEEQEFFEALDDATGCMLGRSMVTVYRNRMPYRMQEKEIYYVMAEGAQTIICTKNESFRSEKSLKEWEEKLDQRLFVKCHRSFLVNLSKILHIEKDYICLCRDYRVSLSRRQRKSVEKAFMMYDIRYR